MKKITLEDLIQICNKHNIHFQPEGLEEKNKKKNRYSYDDNFSLKDYDIYIKWCSGGISGGSCWNTGNATYYSMDGEIEPEFTDLDTILTEIKPDITFLQYKKLINGLITSDSYSVNEYYGNSSTYTYKKFNLKNLIIKLNEI